MINNSKSFKFVMNILVILLTLVCIIPFLLLIMSSVTSEDALALNGYSLIPAEFSFAAYEYLASNVGDILHAYMMSFVITGVGTVISLTLTLLFAYPLSHKDLPGRKAISFFLFFTMLFNGGFVPTYLVYTNLFHITDTLAAMIVPYLLMNAFYVIMMRSYLSTSIPTEVLESARMDGANELQVLGKIVIPMAKPMLATIGLMTAIVYWNNWTNGVYFLQIRRDLYGIQNYLNAVMTNVSFLQSHSELANQMPLPSISIRMALAVIAVIPILAAYPFFQKFFVKGITVGSVKG